MPTEPTTEALLNELIDLLIYINEDTEKWKDLLSNPIFDRHATQGYLGRIARTGIQAKISLPLAQAVIARYAEAESVSMPRETVIKEVAGNYEAHRKQEEYNRKQREQDRS